jgi:Uma2 family endonuclease
MSNVAARVLIPYAEYVAGEERSDTKHQFLKGEVFSMAGGSYDHAMLGGAVISLLNAQLRGKPCRASNSDLRVRIEEADLGTYPDVTVICGEPVHAAADRLAVTNPTLIVEVLSDTTEAFDRGEKFGYYRMLLLLREYVLVSQHKPLIERFVRKDDGSWALTTFGAGQKLYLAAIECELSVDEVYEGLRLEPSGSIR